MAQEGTEGFADLNDGSGKSDAVMGQEDYLAKGINKVLKARQMAQEERAYAEREAAEQGVTLDELGFGKNHFMMKSLGHEFGGDFIEQQVQKKKWLKSGKRFKLGMQKFAKDLQQQTVEKLQKSSGIGGENVEIDKESQSRLRKSLWKNMDAEGTTISALRALEVPDEVEPNDKLVPDTLESTAKAASGKSTKVTREDILNSLMEISKSLGQTAASINQNVSSNSALASSVSELNSGVISSISERTDGIEKRLEDIAAAIKNQTATAVGIVDQKEGTASEDASEETMKGQVDTEAYDDVSTLEDESEKTMKDQVEDLIEAVPAVSDEDGGEPPKAEHGGLIVSGPDSGYPYDLDPNIPGPEVELHGTEKLIPTPQGTQVIPIDNKATDGVKGNEVTPGGDIGSPPKAEMGGIVGPVIQNSPLPKSPEAPVVSSSTSALSSPSPTPKTGIVKLPKFETGGVFGRKSTASAKFKPSTASGITNSGAATKMAQPVMDAMSLPMMVAGGTILSASSKLKSALGPISSPVSKEIDSFARPVADIFGLPNTLTKKAIATSSTTSGGLGGGLGGSNKSMKKKEGNWLDKIGDFFNGLFGNKKNPSGGPAGDPGYNPNAGTGLSGEKGDPNITPGSAEEIRIAAALLTEGAGGTAATDVLQAVANRVKSTGKSYTEILAAPGQFQGVFKRGVDKFRQIETLDDAARWVGGNTKPAAIKRYIADMRNPTLRAASASFVGGAMNFRGSPKTVRAVNSNSDPSDNIEEIGTTGRIPDSIHRGGDGDNQFLTGPGDSKLASAAEVSYDGQSPIAAPSSDSIPTYASADEVPPFTAAYRNSTTDGLYVADGIKPDGKTKWKQVPDPKRNQIASLNNPSPTSQSQTTAFVVPPQQRPPTASTAPVASQLSVASTIQEHSGSSLGNYYGGTNAFALLGYS